jgi:GT2 family glycosyltransferase
MIAQRPASNESEDGLSDRQGGWKVLHIDIADAGALSLESCYDGLYVCFWCEGRPLGHCELLATDLPLSQAQTRNLIARVTAPTVHAYLQSLSTEARDGSAASLASSVASSLAIHDEPLKRLSEIWRNEGLPRSTENVSLVVCTRNRPLQLEQCLRSIAALSLQPSEIIVVDNGSSTGETKRLATSWANVRYVCEPRPGLNRARNAGVRCASGSVIAFTDDDVILSANWLSHLTAAFRDVRVAAASGLVFPAALRTPAQRLFEFDFGGFNRGYEPRLHGPDFVRHSGRKAAPVWNICVGCNMAVRRQTFEWAGWFDERLDAGAAGCSGDSEFWYRILAKGGVCAYVPAAVVHHFHRQDLADLRKQIYDYMRGHVAALLVQFANFRHFANLHRILLELPLDYAELLLRLATGNDKEQRVLLAGARGCVAGIWYWVRHPKSQTSQ